MLKYRILSCLGKTRQVKASWRLVVLKPGLMEKTALNLLKFGLKVIPSKL